MPRAIPLPIAAGSTEFAALLDDLPKAAVAEMTAAMARGDEAAWRTFHREYFMRLHCYLIVLQRGDEDSAADLVQQTCLRVVRHVRRFDSETVFWSWLTCLARCAAADEGRKRKRRLTLFEKFVHWQEMKREGDGQADVGIERVNRSLEEMDPDERFLLEGKYFDRRSYAELAEETGLSAKAVESRLARLRSKLRRALSEEVEP